MTSRGLAQESSEAPNFAATAAAYDRFFWLDGAATRPRSGHRSALGWLAGYACRDGIGTGGGITVQSDIAEEYAEATWKAERLLRALEYVPSPGRRHESW